MLRRATAVFSGMSTRTTTLSVRPSARNGVDKLSNQSHTFHSRGVIHSDLRPENFLVHATTPTSLDLWLCDFGGSTCEELGLGGKHLPDPGFFNPNSEWVSSPATDIFTIGSILFTIVTGNWPHRGPGPFKATEEMEIHDQHVEELFRQSKFPDVEGLFWREGHAVLLDVEVHYRGRRPTGSGLGDVDKQIRS